MRTTIALVTLAVLVAGCGKKEPLKAADNQPLPPKPYTATAQPSSAQLLQTDTQERPTRFNELVTKSQELQSDRFDMPPPG